MTITKLIGVLAIAAGLFTSCSDDDTVENTGPTSTFVLDATNFKGDINDGEVVLDASKIYKLTGRLLVKSGATLTIPAGTRIEGTGGTSAYIAVSQGAKINVNGTAAKPVIMTSASATPAAGNWGGLVICGKAPINRVSGGASEAQSEVAELTYGGTISNDNSGSITYLVVAYAGASYSQTKEFNGLSFFGVGSGTTVSNVQAIHGADDGFEFFGGTVNTSNLISVGNEDDQFDWTEGWNGTNTNWYGKIANGKGNRGIEADNYEFGYGFTPIANPTIAGITLVGPGSTASATDYAENQAFKFRRGTKSLVTNAVIKGWKTGIDIENDETLAFIPTALKVTTVSFEDVVNKATGKKTDGTSSDVTAAFVESNTATGAGNGTAAPAWSAGWSMTF